MKGKKTSNEKIAEVITEVIKNPLEASVRKVARKTNISKTAVHNTIKRELGTIRTPSIKEIIKEDMNIIALGTKEQRRRLEEEPETLRMDEITRATEASTRRSQLLKGEATDNVAIRGFIWQE